jgi:hypothetical protein
VTAPRTTGPTAAKLLPYYAETIVGLLLSRAPAPAAFVVQVLRGLGLTEGDAGAVVAHGLARGLFEVDPEDAALLRTRW